MKKKAEKTLSDLVADILYENCCKGKNCRDCKYDTPNIDCHISNITRIIENYEKENNL